MTQGELLLLLYDELLKRLTMAELSLSTHDEAAFKKDLERCREIVDYLAKTLDLQYPVSRNLKQLYDYFKVHITRIDASRKKGRIDELRDMVRDLRNAFAEAQKQGI